MADRELLELAAKASGMALGTSAFGWDDETLCFWRSEPDKYGISGPWDPDLDDGDSLRLAVEIGASLEINQAYGISYCHALFTDRKIVHHGKDSRAVTRYAVLLCAAEIGKGMK